MMSTKIKKISAVPANQNVVMLAYDINDILKNGDFNPKETIFLKNEAKEEKSMITINRFTYQIIVQLLKKGKKESYFGLEKARRAGDSACGAFNRLKIKEIIIQNTGIIATESLAYVEGMLLGNYQFLKYKKDPKKETNTLQSILLSDAGVKATELTELTHATEAVCIARDLVNEPVNNLNAIDLANAFKKLGKEAGFKVEIFNKARIKKEKMGGLLAVNMGSIDHPTFTIMEWKPKNAKNKKPYVLVGKGVVYDTGGLSLKPTPNSMDSMKCDMAGGAAVGAAMYAIAKNKLPLHVIALVPATDNRPGGNAYVPGDVIKMHSGLTVEMLNADAEGRMILADALSYAKKYKPELVMDFATLTGAAVAAIGTIGTVCMGTAEEKIKNSLKSSANEVYERLVELPIWDEYDDLIKSDIADMKNIGGPYGGAITAGKFLQRYIDYPWMHFDIAGPAFIKSNDSYRGRNGTGTSVRMLYHFFKSL